MKNNKEGKHNPTFREDPIFTRVSNDNLICRDCANRYDDTEIFGNTSRCRAFPNLKPGYVLNGEHCPEYKKEN